MGGGKMLVVPRGLWIAVSLGRLEEVQRLLADGADIDQLLRGECQTTPLFEAALKGLKWVIEMILEHDTDGRNPVDVDTAFSHLQIIDMLRAEAVRRAAVRRVKCEAFMMGQHQRLGAGSRVQELEEGVVRMVLAQV
ncbi:hypothetical protein T484DRAFT_1940260 [Baffinella frigidus]|nr:hypothetical protein T484DRAFT_1940260 [Cryptophyta sp. CCMP2293]|mmetsp:Transcript_37876/g.86324  ORF Transcript_37876/g.86324 Transcript_37876/m.86324 type:complete len:137 (+) Transcript_37876:191-601(+)